MMGSSKYEFNPDQFDIDIHNNKKRYLDKRESIKTELKRIIYQDASQINETWEMVIDVLREMKEKI